MGLMIEAGAEAVTYEDVCNAYIPEPTDSHYPIPHKFIIDSCKDVVQTIFPEFKLINEQYALGGKSRETGKLRHMFGVHTYDTGHPTFGLAIGMRNSVNKNFKASIAAGCNPLRDGLIVCSNLCFSGDAWVIGRKNTMHGQAELYNKLINNAHAMNDEFKRMTRQFDTLELIPVDQDRGYEIIGHMEGTKVIRTNQFSAAQEAWRNPPQEAWEPRNALSLYNAVTEGTKKTSPSRVLDELKDVHSYFMDRYKIVDVEPRMHMVPEEVC